MFNQVDVSGPSLSRSFPPCILRQEGERWNKCRGGYGKGGCSCGLSDIRTCLRGTTFHRRLTSVVPLRTDLLIFTPVHSTHSLPIGDAPEEWMYPTHVHIWTAPTLADKAVPHPCPCSPPAPSPFLSGHRITSKSNTFVSSKRHSCRN